MKAERARSDPTVSFPPGKSSNTLNGADENSINPTFIGLIVAAGLDADADKDGISDIDELKAGTDPLDPISGAKLACATEIEYGCVSRIARPGPIDDVAADASAVVAFIGVFALRRRSRGPH